MKKGDRVMWVYGDGGPGNVAESAGTVVSDVDASGGVAVQWNCDPRNSPTFYKDAHHARGLRLAVIETEDVLYHDLRHESFEYD